MENYPKYLWEILVPTTMDRPRGDGSIKRNSPISIRFHRLWDEKIRRIAGGLTILRPATGHWVDESSNETQIERMIPVRIYCSLDAINKIANMTAQYYAQRAVMFYRVSDEVYIKRYY